MSRFRILFLASAIVALSAEAVAAQSLRDLPIPAEFPPVTYTGTQYVDSKGCVFIRAGVGDNVTWVPRLTRSRKPLCGFAPSLASATPTTAETPKPQRRATAAPVTPVKPAKPAVAPARAPERVIVIKAPAPTAAPAPRTTAKPARTLTPPAPGRTVCAGLSGVSVAYSVQHTGSPVRCGPQAAHYATYAHGGGQARFAATVPSPGTRATPDTVPPYTRVAPARVYASQQTSLAGIRVPEGMKPVWEDDRLNPHRAHQTFEGKAQMELMWTRTVPRRLIDRRTGADVIHNFPGLTPPHTSFAAQRAAGVTVATRGAYVPDPVTKAEARRGAAAAPRATVSTRSDPATKANATPQTTGQKAHYAQAGLFADAAQGRAAATRVAQAGLPARQGTLNRDGRRLTVVLAGPFGSEADARAGAARLRGMGFGNVRLR